MTWGFLTTPPLLAPGETLMPQSDGAGEGIRHRSANDRGHDNIRKTRGMLRCGLASGGRSGRHSRQASGGHGGEWLDSRANACGLLCPRSALRRCFRVPGLVWERELKGGHSLGVHLGLVAARERADTRMNCRAGFLLRNVEGYHGRSGILRDEALQRHSHGRAYRRHHDGGQDVLITPCGTVIHRINE